MNAFALFFCFLALTFTDETAKWRADYEAALRAPLGWLSVSGLTWLHEGENSVGSAPGCDIVLPKEPNVPARAGVIRFSKGVAVWEPANGAKRALKPDSASPADVVNAGRVSFTIIVRGEKTGVLCATRTRPHAAVSPAPDGSPPVKHGE